MTQEQHNEASDAFINAIPDDVYDLCPCGCGKKWKFVLKQPEEHYNRFVEEYIKNDLTRP